uniref:Lactose-binding lectin l-2-like n=2 Tax=Cynoglossus semilaevis TaxID=244447 RepID=A0A3P8VN64_CYNSE
MILHVLLFAVFLGAVSPSGEENLQRGVCPLFWFGYNDRCYKYVATPMTWADAELHCLSHGANLVSMHSLDEHTFVRTLIKNFDPFERPAWIGLSDTHKEGNWMWSDGCPVKYVLWDVGQPDNRQVENCGHINNESSKKWNDAKCTYNNPFVCASRVASCPSLPNEQGAIA